MQNKITDYKEFFKNKKITVMGLGLLGRGVGDAVFLAECGAKLIVTDLKNKEELKKSLRKLKKFKDIKYVLGEHKLEDFRNADLVLKNPAIPLDSIYIKEARKNKIPVEMSATLFAKFFSMPIVAVTGTRGKSTVTHLIAHILESAGKKIILGGNVRSVSNLQLLKNLKNKELAVFELDSWQLQGFGDSKISPNISVFTTFFPDHMGYYGSTTLTTGKAMKKYFADKANIFKYQKKEDLLIVGKQALPFVKKWQEKNNKKIKSKIIVPKEKLSKNWKFNLPGLHNEYNAQLAIQAAQQLGVKDAVIKKALKNFKGVSGRLEFIREVNGVKYYNDTTATTPEATIAGIEALRQDLRGKNIILILGGSDKRLDMNALIKEIPKYCKAVVFIPGSGTEKLLKNYDLKIPNQIGKNLKDVIKTALGLASRGDIILFSPAFASFGMFKNEFDRGDQFMKIVKSLK